MAVVVTASRQMKLIKTTRPPEGKGGQHCTGGRVTVLGLEKEVGQVTVLFQMQCAQL